MENSICCPEFNKQLWDEKTHNWLNKLFFQDSVFQIMHIPMNMGTVITRMCKKIEDANAKTSPEEFLMLCYDPSPWKSEINMTVTKDIPGGKMVRMSGVFVSKVFDGPYNHVPKWIKEMDTYLASNGKKALKYFFHYAYCPKCAKKYGHNYCIAFAQVE